MEHSAPTASLTQYSVRRCIAYCTDRFYAYAALTRGYQCRCGNQYGLSAGSQYTLAETAEQVLAANGEQVECRMGCAGADDVYDVRDRGWSCGAYQRLAIYTRATAVPCGPTHPDANVTSLTCRVPPLFRTLTQYLEEERAWNDREEVCEAPSDSMADKMCYGLDTLSY